MNRKIRLLLIALLSLVVISGVSTFAYFYFERRLEGNVDIGKITNTSVRYYYNDENGNNVDFVNNEKGYDATKETLTCYASIATIDDTEGYLQLCDIYASVHVEAEISVRVRVKIEDAWCDNKIFYSDGRRTTSYNIIPDVSDFKNTNGIIVDNGPFIFGDNWTKKDDGYVYYDLIVKGENDIDFIVNGSNQLDYYYMYDRSSVAYRSIMFTEIKIIIEVVQANRAHELWGI